MLDQVSAAFGIVPDVDLDLMDPEQTLSEITARVVAGVEAALADLSPDLVLVHGDTTTCLASALAAFYLKIPIGHVEAGLRTRDLDAPWPEEMNRRLTDPISRWCFAPTERAVSNLKDEGIGDERIFLTGNTAVDALLIARERNREIPLVIPELPGDALDGRRLILVTGHRRESFGASLRQCCLALREIVRLHADTVLVYPVHPNPNVQRPVREILLGQERIHLIPPVEYLSFVSLLEKAYLIVTDSGGIQEEAPSLHVPVLVTRSATERPEAIEQGMAHLVGTSYDVLLKAASWLLSDREAYDGMTRGENPFGDGHAAEKNVEILNTTSPSTTRRS
jgi:UDP-N-acetylglucosamine 2-epimerase